MAGYRYDIFHGLWHPDDLCEMLAKKAPFDLAEYLARQQKFSLATFGPGPRVRGLIAHIEKELREIEQDPTDIFEWVDVLILAFDGALRSGATPQQVIAALVSKQAKNEGRTWPAHQSQDVAVEHDRDAES